MGLPALTAGAGESSGDSGREVAGRDCLAGVVSSASIKNSNASAFPSWAPKTPCFAASGIVDQGALPGQAEEAFVKEYIHVGKENSMARMGVIPADDAQIGVLPVHQHLDVLPGVGRERDLSGAAGGGLAFDDVFDERERAELVAIDIADENAADLRAWRRIAVNANAVQRPIGGRRTGTSRCAGRSVRRS